jgi:hypothetical protein
MPLYLESVLTMKVCMQLVWVTMALFHAQAQPTRMALAPSSWIQALVEVRPVCYPSKFEALDPEHFHQAAELVLVAVWT